MSTLCDYKFNFSPQDFQKYHDYIFFKGLIRNYDGPNSYTRMYIIDVSNPARPDLLGYINLPYIANDTIFDHNFLYVSTENSSAEDAVLYRYDLTAITSGLTTPAENAPEEEVPAGEEEKPTGEIPEGVNEDGEKDSAPAQSLPITLPAVRPYWPWLPGWLMLSPYWSVYSMAYNSPFLSYLRTDPLIYREPALTYRFDSSIRGWSIPPLPFSYIDFFLSTDYGRQLNIPADYPQELFRPLLY